MDNEVVHYMAPKSKTELMRKSHKRACGNELGASDELFRFLGDTFSTHLSNCNP